MRSSLKYDLTLRICVGCWSVPCPTLHWRPTFCPSCPEFVYPGCWHFGNSATRKFDDVLLEHGGLLAQCPSFCCPPNFFCQTRKLVIGGTILNLSYPLSFFVEPLLHA